MMVHGRGLLAAMTLALVTPRVAHARSIRPLFEPTDLEMEETGVVEVDLQFGGIRSQGPWRMVVPDFEVDVGLLPSLEVDVDVDGGYAIEGPAKGPFRFDHAPRAPPLNPPIANPASHTLQEIDVAPSDGPLIYV